VSSLFIGIGFLNLLAGRPFYAVFVGSIGFWVGTFLTDRVLIASPGWNDIVLPLILAAFGALGAFVFRRISADLAGFIAGGYLAMNLPTVFGASGDWDSWILFVLGGGVSFILLLIWFDFTLILLSSMTGVAFILSNLRVTTIDIYTMFLVLIIFGILTQFLLLQYGSPSPD